MSDSGIIGVIVASVEGNVVKIDELVISCRALGRQIETLMLGTAFQYLIEKLNTKKNLLIDFVIGPRNMPAKTWLEHYAQKKITSNGIVSTSIHEVAINPYVIIQFL